MTDDDGNELITALVDRFTREFEAQAASDDTGNGYANDLRLSTGCYGNCTTSLDGHSDLRALARIAIETIKGNS